jgi:hypothetical protein
MAFVMCSCNLTPVPQYESVETDLPMEGFINDFLTNNPNFFNNDITIEEGNKVFIKNLEDTLKTTDGRMNLFDGIPVRLRTINKNKRLGGYVAQFDSTISPYGFKFHYVSDINFDVFCIIPDSLATTLKEDEHYILDGVYVGHLTYNKCVQTLGKDTWVWNPIVEIKKDKTYSSDYYQRKVNLGCVLLLFDDIKKYQCRETQMVEKKQ